MLSSLGITHHVSPTSPLFFGGKKALNWLAEKEEKGTAGLFHERSPLRELSHMTLEELGILIILDPEGEKRDSGEYQQRPDPPEDPGPGARTRMPVLL
ncbi:hypothetical protein EYF80_034457 [Liparis tanakae]|uniref:Uncharacterized protein n=1 Tax=Liparis tanakae TaxID=230148 RepID=A0A4Z2GQF2_9TELE|nr:hypothetical protein EYF80_034457 [Liparis tanakae]